MVGPWGIGEGMGTRRDCMTGVDGTNIGACAAWPHDRQPGDCTTGATGTWAGAIEVVWKGAVCIGDCTIGAGDCIIGDCMYP